MSIVKKFLLFILMSILVGLPLSTEAFRSCESLYRPGKVYNKIVMKRCEKEFARITAEAIASFPKELWM